MIPLYQRERTNALLMTVSSFLLLLLPFIVLPFLVLFSIAIHSFMGGYNSAQIYDFLLLVDIMAITILFLTGILQSKYTLFQNSIYTLGSPLAGAIIFFAFISSILDALKENAVDWKDRKYTIKERY
jgi:hypothetical protein